MFSAYDLQLNQYFGSGRNSETLEECQEGILTFLLDGEEFTDEECEEIFNSPEKRAQTITDFDVRIDEHEEPIEDEE